MRDSTTSNAPPICWLSPLVVARCIVFSALVVPDLHYLYLSGRRRSPITQVIHASAWAIQMSDLICSSSRAVPMKVSYAMWVALFQKILSVSMSSCIYRLVSAAAESSLNAARHQRFAHYISPALHCQTLSIIRKYPYPSP